MKRKQAKEQPPVNVPPPGWTREADDRDEWQWLHERAMRTGRWT